MHPTFKGLNQMCSLLPVLKDLSEALISSSSSINFIVNHPKP